MADTLNSGLYFYMNQIRKCYAEWEIAINHLDSELPVIPQPCKFNNWLPFPGTRPNLLCPWIFDSEQQTLNKSEFCAQDFGGFPTLIVDPHKCRRKPLKTNLSSKLKSKSHEEITLSLTDGIPVKKLAKRQKSKLKNGFLRQTDTPRSSRSSSSESQTERLCEKPSARRCLQMRPDTYDSNLWLPPLDYMFYLNDTNSSRSGYSSCSSNNSITVTVNVYAFWVRTLFYCSV